MRRDRRRSRKINALWFAKVTCKSEAEKAVRVHEYATISKPSLETAGAAPIYREKVSGARA